MRFTFFPLFTLVTLVVTCAQELPENKTAVPMDDRFFLNQLFEKYGDDGVMTFEGFEHLLANLGLGRLVLDDHDLTVHRVNGSFAEVHDTLRPPLHEHDHGPSSTTPRSSTRSQEEGPYQDRKKRNAPEEDAPSEEDVSSTNHNMDHNYLLQWKVQPGPETMCLTAPEILVAYGLNPHHTPIFPLHFLRICPAIVYELDQRTCWKRPPRNMDDVVSVIQEHSYNETKVWLYATISVLVISLVGLLGVAIIPVMQKMFYQHLIQFLVSLAVGSLAGDALLHLLPHALESKHGHQSASHGSHELDLDDHGSHEHEHDEANESHDHQEQVWKMLSTCIMIVVFFLMEKLLQRWRSSRNSRVEKKEMNKEAMYKEEMMPINEDKQDIAKEEQSATWGCPNTKSDKEEYTVKVMADDPVKDKTNGYALMVQNHNTEHHGHGHSHSHALTPSDSVSSVAWMVIMGDGLHNFSDGLAIGAAFAAGITTGISTTFAVFCHELPHEIGDFAVLIKSGMTVKQGLLYNMVSSLLCFLGMIIGILLSNYESASSWIFAGAAGTFLYIALVDLIPELNTNSSKSPMFDLMLQLLGMSIGGSIMLFMGLYEPQLKTLFDSL